jgi:hypothetical protein
MRVDRAAMVVMTTTTTTTTRTRIFYTVLFTKAENEMQKKLAVGSVWHLGGSAFDSAPDAGQAKPPKLRANLILTVGL